MYDCDDCGKVFTQKKNLKKHIDNGCPCTNFEKLCGNMCINCEKKFTNHFNLVRHQKICGKSLVLYNHEQEQEKDLITISNRSKPTTNSYYQQTFHIQNNIHISHTNPEKEKIIKIFSIPIVNDKFCYVMEYMNDIKQLFCFERKRTLNDYSFPFLQIFMKYMDDVYFNKKYPVNFSFIYYKEQEGKILLKDNDRWFIINHQNGLEKLFINGKQNFIIFIDHLIKMDFIQEEIKKLYTNSKIIRNFFLHSYQKFVYDLNYLEKNRCFFNPKSINDNDCTESIREIYYTFDERIKSNLLLMQKVMKYYYDMDEDNPNKIG